jgi:hypothetical protein
LLTYLPLENVNDAVARSIELSLNWQDKNNHPSHDMLRYGNHNVLCHDIVSGRISAWVIYNCDSGQKFLNELNAEQLAMIWPYIDSDIWQRKFADYAADQVYVQDILKQAGW